MSTDGTPAAATPQAPPRSFEERKYQEIGKKYARAYDRAHAAEKERDELRKEVDEFRKQIADLTKTSTDAEVLKAELRTLKHRQVVDKLLDEAGINPDAKDAWYKLSDVQFEGDTPSPEKYKVAVEESKGKLSYLFNGQEDSATPPVPGPGRGQGGTGQPPAGRFQTTQEQLRDPAWCFAHKAELAAAAKDVMGLPVNQVGDKFTIL